MATTWLPRLLGAATAAYGAAIIVKPSLLLKPTGLSQEDQPSSALATLVRTVGARDVASGLAMVAAPDARSLRVAIAVRCASDLGDASLLGYALRGKQEQAKTVAVAGLWGLLCAASALTTRG